MTCPPTPISPSAESTFPGLGRDRCRICNQPTRDHNIGPCPQFTGPKLTLPAVSTRTIYRRRAEERRRR